MISLETYTKENQSFKSSLVFRLGIDAGFFSEFNNMILAMVWCLENDVQFKFYSRDAWWGDIGWGSFFQPFTKEVTLKLHSITNNRLGAPPNKLHRLIGRLHRWGTPGSLLTYERWNYFRNPDWDTYHYDLPEINFQGSLQGLCRHITQMIWHYNEGTSQAVSELITQINMNEPYLGLHIRGGDKYLEDELHGFGKYLSEMTKYSELRTAFILTDDYQAFVKAQKAFPEWNLSTLCEEDEIGYYHQDFMKMPKDYIRRKTLRLFASVDIMKDAEYFMGTFSSNPGMFLGMRMEAGRCLSVDGSKWRIW